MVWQGRVGDHSPYADYVGADAFVRPAEAKRGVTAASVDLTLYSASSLSLRALRATPDECVRGYTLWSATGIIVYRRDASDAQTI